MNWRRLLRIASRPRQSATPRLQTASSAKQSKPLPKVLSSISFHISSSHCGAGILVKVVVVMIVSSEMDCLSTDWIDVGLRRLARAPKSPRFPPIPLAWNAQSQSNHQQLLMDSDGAARQVVAEMPKATRFPPIPAVSPPRGRPARTIEVLAFPDVQMLDLTGPLQVFATANEQAVQAGSAPPYVLRVVAKDTAQVTASAGLQIATATLPRASATLDTLIIAGGPGVDAAAADQKLCAWVRRRAGRARRVASVCTGAFVLGAS